MVAELGVMNGGKRRSVRKSCGDMIPRNAQPQEGWQA